MATQKQHSIKIPNLRFSEFDGEWVFETLGKRAAKVGSGVTPRGGADAYVASGIPLLRSQNVRDSYLELSNVAFIDDDTHASMSGSQVEVGDVLLNITGASIGRSAVVPTSFIEGNVNQHVCIIRLKEKNSPKFLQAILASHQGQKLIFQSQSGSGREGLNFQNIRNFKIAFPEQPEQEKIAAFLGAMDEKLSQLTRKKALLTQYENSPCCNAVYLTFCCPEMSRPNFFF